MAVEITILASTPKQSSRNPINSSSADFDIKASFKVIIIASEQRNRASYYARIHVFTNSLQIL
jgi:hypothetical protein